MKQRVTLPVLAPKLEHGQSFSINPTIGTSADPGLAKLNTDLLVVTQTSNGRFSHRVQQLDDALEGRLSQEARRANFSGQLCDQLVVVETGGNVGAKFVLLLGIGAFAGFSGEVVCQTFEQVLKVASAKGLRSVTLYLPPNRQTAHRINLRGTVAILSCRLSQFLAANPQEEQIKVEFYCTPQSARHVAAGLAVRTARCSACHRVK